MCVNFEVNTHLVSEICQDNKKIVNIELPKNYYCKKTVYKHYT